MPKVKTTKRSKLKSPIEASPRLETLANVIAHPQAALDELQYLRRIVAAIDQTLDELDLQLPDAHGGKFTKKFAANVLRGLKARAREKEV